MQRGIRSMSVNENVGVEGDHGSSVTQRTFTLIIDRLIDRSGIHLMRSTANCRITQSK